ncbi:baseplate J/gp47 family protein [Variovorax sp. J22P168]|uniref:baseplate J/gp47 family protein n=1 Tax=Variovorax jilinensis TaxID=3053513 RepID=UPI002578746D|nr:baseplate J/gp47 family protein [Variovorax sp. J22P168]MDM0011743.1 baseplate J/gp47 family protein [Variovorax sp. J22P168]
MPILPPSLDDRRFDDLVEDLIARIPAHTPEWTNPRLGDPGRTLIELFAWLGDALLYRANLIPERQRLVFLKLLGMGLKPALPARAIVSLAYAQPTELGAHTLAPHGSVKAAQPFETLAETTVLPLVGEAYIKRRLTPQERADRSELLQGLARIHGLAGLPQGYETTPVFAEGRAVPGGIDVFGRSADRALWVALLAPVAPRPVDQPSVNAAATLAMGTGGGGLPALLSVGVVPALAMPALFEAVAVPVPVPVLWELTTQGASGFATDYLTLGVQPGSDSSNGLARAGTLRLQLPGQREIWAPPNDVGLNPLAGVGDAPPRLDDPDRASRLVAWLRLRPKPGESIESLKLAWVGINAAEVDQRTTVTARVLGVSTGAGSQSFALPSGSVDPASLQVQVEEPGLGYRDWHAVGDLAAISADAAEAREARVFQLDAEAGTLLFGDGVRGRVPEREMRVRLAIGRFGGGRAGNLPPGSMGELRALRIDGRAAPAIAVQQPLAADGGEDAETLALAEHRIPAMLRHRDRAVTEEDYRRLSAEAPGIDVGRIEVLPRFKPADRRFDVPGVVSVMGLPDAPLQPAPNPRPDRPFIERLHAHLAARVPLATELYVIGCDYVALGIAVAVRLRDGHARDKVLLEVREALRRLLWPLAPGGLDRKGWPLGRAVRSRELEVEVSRVDGVDELRGITLFQRNGEAWQALPSIASDGAQVLALLQWQLPELLAVVAVEGDAPPTDLSAVPNPFADDNAVAVPVVPEVC